MSLETPDNERNSLFDFLSSGELLAETPLSQKELFRESFLASTPGCLNHGPDFEYRPYQLHGELAFRDCVEEGHETGYFTIGTAGGKTVMYMEIVAKAKGKKLIVVPTKEAYTRVMKGVATIQEHMPPEMQEHNAKVCYLREGTTLEEALEADIVVVSWQKLIQADETETRIFEKIPQDHFGLAIIDEAHRILGATNHKIPYHFDAYTVAYTATPKSGGKHIGAIYERELLSVPLEKLIEDGFCPPVIGHRYYIEGEDLGNIPSSTDSGDYQEQKKLAALNLPERFKVMEGIIMDILTNTDETFIAYLPSREIGRDFMTYMEKHGQDLPIAYIDGETQGRDDIMERFRRKEIRGVINVHILDESSDIPHVSNIIMGDPTRSETIYIQRLGRGTRWDEENPDKITKVHDLVSTMSNIAGRQHMTLHGYFGIDHYIPGALTLTTKEQKEETAALINDSNVYASIPLNERILMNDTTFMRNTNTCVELTHLFSMLGNVTMEEIQFHLQHPEHALPPHWNQLCVRIEGGGYGMTICLGLFTELVWLYEQQEKILPKLPSITHIPAEDRYQGEFEGRVYMKKVYTLKEAHEIFSHNESIAHIDFSPVKEDLVIPRGQGGLRFEHCIFRQNTLRFEKTGFRLSGRHTFHDCLFEQSMLTTKKEGQKKEAIIFSGNTSAVECSIEQSLKLLERDSKKSYTSFINCSFKDIALAATQSEDEEVGISPASLAHFLSCDFHNVTHYSEEKLPRSSLAKLHHTKWLTGIRHYSQNLKEDFIQSFPKVLGKWKYELERNENTHTFTLRINELFEESVMITQEINSEGKTKKRDHILSLAKEVFRGKVNSSLNYRRILTFANPNFNVAGQSSTPEEMADRMLVEFHQIWGPLGFKREDLIFIEHTGIVAKKIRELIPEAQVIERNFFQPHLVESIQKILRGEHEELAAIIIDPFDSYKNIYMDRVREIMDANLLCHEAGIFVTNFYANRVNTDTVMELGKIQQETFRTLAGVDPHGWNPSVDILYPAPQANLPKNQAKLGNIASSHTIMAMYENCYNIINHERGSYRGTGKSTKMLYDIFAVKNGPTEEMMDASRKRRMQLAKDTIRHLPKRVLQ